MGQGEAIGIIDDSPCS